LNRVEADSKVLGCELSENQNDGGGKAGKGVKAAADQVQAAVPEIPRRIFDHCHFGSPGTLRITTSDSADRRKDSGIISVWLAWFEVPAIPSRCYAGLKKSISFGPKIPQDVRTELKRDPFPTSQIVSRGPASNRCTKIGHERAGRPRIEAQGKLEVLPGGKVHLLTKSVR